MRIIAGEWRGRTLMTPPGRKTRPTTDRVREAWMSAIQFDLPQSRVVDLFAGSGALGLEALSRGAGHVTFVERGAAALKALESNIQKLGAASGATIVRTDAIAYASRLEPGEYDLALADPPYGEGLAARLAEIFAASPFAHWLWIEHETGASLPPLPGLASRRYGDTTLTRIPAPE
jgi:16S rRNA (guanine966-N2)-methyltransferase